VFSSLKAGRALAHFRKNAACKAARFRQARQDVQHTDAAWHIIKAGDSTDALTRLQPLTSALRTVSASITAPLNSSATSQMTSSIGSSFTLPSCLRARQRSPRAATPAKCPEFGQKEALG
jgi:hypothetical protein